MSKYLCPRHRQTSGEASTFRKVIPHTNLANHLITIHKIEYEYIFCEGIHYRCMISMKLELLPSPTSPFPNFQPGSHHNGMLLEVGHVNHHLKAIALMTMVQKHELGLDPTISHCHKREPNPMWIWVMLPQGKVLFEHHF